VRRFATLALTFMLTIGLCASGRLQAQDPKKDDKKPAETKPAEAKPAETKKDEPKPAEAAKKDEPKPSAAPAEVPLPPIPPAVEAKRQAALKAVAEYIVDAQDAGLVETTINPPPIVDLLATGRALDKRELKAGKGVSPEVFGGWFTRQNTPMEGITAQADVRIFQPSMGLQDLYDARSGLLLSYMDTYKKAKDAAAPKPAAPKPAETKKADAPKPAEAKKEEKKAEAPKPAEAKPAEAKKADAPKPAEAKKEAAKPADAAKKP
jgi:outer membrane biosynthesis protein TonB